VHTENRYTPEKLVGKLSDLFIKPSSEAIKLSEDKK
jgi:hypothetical protein